MGNLRLTPAEHRLAWCQHDQTTNLIEPMEVYLELDIEKQRISVNTYYQMAVCGIPSKVNFGITRRYELSPFTDAIALTADVNNGKFDKLFQRILSGSSIEWDDHNHVGRLTADAIGAEKELADRLETYILELDIGGLWEAGDWLQLCSAADFGIMVKTTDDELWEITRRETANALREDVILVGAEEYFGGLRDRLREATTDGAETLV